MEKSQGRSALAALCLAVLAFPAGAHIEYYDLNQGKRIGDLTAAGKAVAGNDIPLSNPIYWNATYQTSISTGETWTNLGGSFTSGTWGYSVRPVGFDTASWTDGLRSDPKGGNNLLGDSHRLGFANFHLSQASYVTITITDDFAGQGFGLNPSFSLFRGSAVYQAHDDTPGVDPLNPSPKVQNPKDTGSVVDSQGIVSAFRDTLNNSGRYEGQFNALGGFSVGNPEGYWSAVQYLASATGFLNPDGTWTGNANSNGLANHLLPAGDYIIAFGGNAAPADYSTPRSGSNSDLGVVTFNEQIVTLAFSASAAPAPPIPAVPEPRTWALMLCGAGIVAGIVRRRARKARTA